MIRNLNLQEKVTVGHLMVGLSLLGKTMSGNAEEAGTAVADLLMGQMDAYVAVVAFEREHEKMPETFEHALNDEKAKEGLERMKQFWRNRLERALTHEARQEELRMRREHEAKVAKVSAAFKDMNKPAPEGTVKELAAKYGKSISEIRRMKAEGRLSELEAQA